MRGTRALLLTLGLICWPACEGPGARDPSGAPETMAECEQSARLESAPQMPENFDPLVIRAQAELDGHFALRALCIRVDRRTVYVRNIEAPTVIRSRFEVPVALRRGGAHRVDVLALYDGTASVTGYKFAIRSAHDITAEEVGAGALLMRILAKGGPDTPVERRPTIAWTAEPAVPPAAPPAE